MAKTLFLISCLLSLCPAGLFADQASVERLLKEGVALHDQRRYDEAIANYKKVLEEEPDNLVALDEMAFSYYMKKDYSHSLETASKGAQSQSPYQSAFYEIMGNCYDDMGKTDKALAVYKKGVEIDPQNERLLYNLALAYTNAGQADQALERLKKCAVMNPAHASAQRALGILYAQSGRCVPAVLALCRFLTLEPDSERSGSVLGKLEELLRGGVSKDDSTGKINITLEDGEKDSEGDFTDLALMLSFSKAVEKTDMKGVSIPGMPWRTDTFKSLFAALGSTHHSKDTHFAYSYYRPYFTEMEKRGLVEPFCYYIYQSGGSPEVTDWLKAHTTEVKKFMSWSETFSLKP